MLRDARPADAVLIAQNAPYEAGILYDWAAACPTLARIPLIDTVRLACRAYPDLPSRRLDDLLRYMQLPVPARRHRAMPNVEATSAVFARLLVDGAADGLWATLDQLYRVAGIVPKAVTKDKDAAKPRHRQEELF
ncbi:3'-5' exonuclease [Streptomyces sp. NPDC004752]